MPMDANLASLWAFFETSVLDPIAASPVQRQESRRAFYSGAGAMFELVMKATAPENEELCMAMLSELEHELLHFGELLKKGQA